MARAFAMKAQQSMFKFVLKARSAIQICTKEVLQEVGVRLVERSPYGMPEYWKNPAHKGYMPGQFKANWQLGVDARPVGILSGRDPMGLNSMLALGKSIPRWPVGHTYYFTNNLPYARLLETGLHSPQVPPGGMIGLTKSEFGQIVRQVEQNYSSRKI